MQTELKARDPFIDVVKGIGILSIVIGHASWDINAGGFTLHAGPFVYLYHLAVFFFCSGYLYKDNVVDYWEFAARKLKGLYGPFLVYSILYLVCRNLFIYLGILQATCYSPGEWIIMLTNTIAFQSVGEFLSAFWFLPVLFFSLCLYTAVMYLTRGIQRKVWREGIRILCFAVAGVVGLYTTEHQYGMLFNLQISYLMIPVIALGHYFAVCRERLKWIVNPAGLVVSFLTLVWVVELDIGIIELIRYQIINHYVFYPVTICGIWFCLCLGKLIGKSRRLTGLFALAGRMSFDIMALHFLALKLVDFIVCHITGKTEIMAEFPHSFTGLWPVYYIVGMAVPILLKKAWMKVYGKRSRKEGM
ncbi:MAG: acyltransferase family protein [Eubacterium sp.]|nr:acyltransferase family protein [Eubacterium sp.]